jgi:predicted DCC family thiol-disulfide oxidoreductase YuxK
VSADPGKLAAADRSARGRPLLVYDGDCTFCAYWARYWQALTGDQVEYRPYQEVAAQFPEIPLASFQRAVQYVGTDGRIAAAAEASLLTLSHAPGKGFWLALYRHLPGFAPLAERAYRFTAAHRGGFYRVSLLLWGRDYRPPRFEQVTFLFLRLLGLIYLAAFVSFTVQAQGLIGSHGILPLSDLLDAIRGSIDARRYWLAPMLFWLNDSDLAIQVVCWMGIAASVLLTVNILSRLSLLLLYAAYLSLLYAGQEFMTYQWDVFLLETGFLALLMSWAPRPGLWLLRWLLFRFMFMSGMVKLLSGDPHWRDLTALAYHFLTQPLPTPLAWYAAQLPKTLLSTATGAMLLIELLLPCFIFCPRRLRFVGAGGILLLQACILLTGNYNWFNLQTMALCLLLFDDAALSRVLPRWLPRHRPVLPRGSMTRFAVAALVVLLVLCSLVQMDMRFGGTPPRSLLALERLAEPLHLVSGYGLFAVMTTERDEIVIEGSMDGHDWRAYEFRYKPGELDRAPPWNIPHQPRLDWQMWFASLEDPRGLRWFWRFMKKLLENDPAVTALLRFNPFPHQPPRYLRAQFYAYTYADPQQKANGQWWNRRLLGAYSPVVTLKADDNH